MQRIAIISDIHGNIPALETVLADIRKRGIDTIYCLGDLIGKGPHSALAVDMCREICAVIVRGNWDVHVTNPSDSEHIQWQQEQLGQQRLEYLRQLPNAFDFELGGKRIRLFHASQVSEHTRILAYAPYETHLAMFDNTDFTGYDNPQPDVVGYGDIHVAYMQTLHRDHRILFNAGSVGNALDIPLATYTILSGNGSQTFNIEFIRLSYDIERAIQDAVDCNMPETEPYAVELRTAVYRGRQQTPRKTLRAK